MANSTLKTILEQTYSQSSLFDFDSTTGQLIPNTDNVLSAIKLLVSDILGGNVNTEEETPLGRLCEAWALSFAKFCSVTAVYANQINPNYATGQMLDALGSIFSISRTGATPVVINITCAGTVNTVIPANSQISDGKGNKFTIQSAITIPAGGAATGKAVCTENGEKTIATGTVTNIDSSVSGWLSVTNTGINTPGTAMETDLHFRTRVSTARWTGTAFVQAIQSEIERLDGIDSAIVAENVYSAERYLKEDRTLSEYTPSTGEYIRLKPHSICVIVYSRSWNDSTHKLPVAEAVYNTKSVGCDYTSLGAADQFTTKGTEVKQNVTDDSSGMTYEILYNKPLEVSFGVDVTVGRGSFTGNDTDLIAKVKEAITKWSYGEVPFVDGLGLGKSLYSYEIGAAISDVIPEIQVKSVLLRNGSSSTQVQSISIFVNKVGVLNTASGGINVTVEA